MVYWKQKQSVNELAIFGGDPLFDAKMHVGAPNIGNKEDFLKRVDQIFDARYLTNDGPQVKEFEAKVKGITKAKHVIAVCNATIGLELVASASGLTGEVIVPSYTFIASANSLSRVGIKPVFCEIDASHTINLRHAESLITSRTSGILAVNLWGRPANIDGLESLAKHKNLKLIFDSAHAFHCSYKNRPIGTFGHAEVFSFHATKFINSFEGGAVTTNDDELATKLRCMRNSGFGGYDNVTHIGTNAKMSEISAAMGNTSIESMANIIETNKKHYEMYQQLLGHLDGVSVLKYDTTEQCNYQYIVLELDHQAITLTRDEIQQILWAENILARKYFWPACHRMKAYATVSNGLYLPVTEAISDRVIVMPTGTALTSENIAKICQFFADIMAHQDDIKDRFKMSTAA